MPAITTTTAIVHALGAVGAREVLLVTPYIDTINRTEIVFLEGSGIAVRSLVTFGLELSEAIAAVPWSRVRDAVMDARGEAEAADAVFVSCTNLRTMDRIDEIEDALGRPVVTSNQATLWAIHREAGLAYEGEDGGSLLRTLGPPAGRQAGAAG